MLFFCADMAKRFEEKEHYYIPVEQELIEVSREVYMAYYQEERRERYLKEQDQKHGMFYVGDMESEYMKESFCPLEEQEGTDTQAIHHVYLEYLMEGLEKEEQDVFRLCCLEGYPLRAAADKMGTHYLKVGRILKHIRRKIKCRL